MLILARQNIYNTEMNDIRDCAVQFRGINLGSLVIANDTKAVHAHNRDDLSDDRDLPSEDETKR